MQLYGSLLVLIFPEVEDKFPINFWFTQPTGTIDSQISKKMTKVLLFRTLRIIYGWSMDFRGRN